MVRRGLLQETMRDVLGGPALGDGCVIWPGKPAQNGYGQLTVDGVRQPHPHVLVCQHFHGPRPARAQVRHLCGVKLCVAPWHLTWGTAVQNAADKIAHGTHNRGERNGTKSPLSEMQVREIITLLPTTRQADLARRYGVTPNRIHAIAHGYKWAWLKKEMEMAS